MFSSLSLKLNDDFMTQKVNAALELLNHVAIFRILIVYTEYMVFTLKIE